MSRGIDLIHISQYCVTESFSLLIWQYNNFSDFSRPSYSAYSVYRYDNCLYHPFQNKFSGVAIWQIILCRFLRWEYLFLPFLFVIQNWYDVACSMIYVRHCVIEIVLYCILDPVVCATIGLEAEVDLIIFSRKEITWRC